MTHAARTGRGRSLRLPQASTRSAAPLAARTTTPLAMMTRRRFLALAQRAAIATALTTQARLLAGCADAASPSDAAWRDLASRLGGRVLRPGEPGYLEAALPYNLRWAGILPAGIARCATAEDVATSILWSRENGIDLAARSGGHSYAGYSSTIGLQIDVGDLSTATVDPSRATATVGAGVRNGGLSAALEPHGFAMSQGRCPTVSVSGLTLGGGFGFSARRFGLTCDALTETTLVTADGAIVTCNAASNPDLYWACRGGGGGSFGINTSFTFTLGTADDVAVYEIEWRGRDAAASVYAALQQILARASDALSLRIGLRVQRDANEDQPVLTALGQLFGSSDELRALLAPAFAAAPPRREVIADLSFYEGKDFLADLGPPHGFAERSSYTSGPLAEAGIDVLLDGLARWPGTAGTGFVSTFGWGGAIARVAPEATAVVHRDTLLLVALGSTWGETDDGATIDAALDWLDGFFADLQPHVLPQSYQNFSDPALIDWQRAYYGANLARLAAIKAQIDPDDVFRFAQSVPAGVTALAAARRAASA